MFCTFPHFWLPRLIWNWPKILKMISLYIGSNPTLRRTPSEKHLHIETSPLRSIAFQKWRRRADSAGLEAEESRPSAWARVPATTGRRPASRLSAVRVTKPYLPESLIISVPASFHPSLVSTLDSDQTYLSLSEWRSEFEKGIHPAVPMNRS